MAAALGLSACLVGGVLGVVGLKVNQVRASYRLNELRVLRNDLEELNRQLRVEQATLSSLARIESVARIKLGMAPPLLDQVRIAREYVGGSGAETADVVRTAWEARMINDAHPR
jgi:cell division protein FtsL